MIQSRRRLRAIALTIAVFVTVNLIYVWLTRHAPQSGLSQLSRGDEGGTIGLGRFVKNSYNWGALQPHFPVTSMVALPSGNPLPLLKIQHEFAPESEDTRALLDLYRREIRAAFLRCWRSYRKHAWLRDELTPLSGRGKDTLGGWAATLIDSLDTLWIMGLKAEFKEAVEAVATLDWEKTESKAANTFETTIRHLGGLLSAYDLSGEKVLLLKAIEIGDLLYAGFDRPNHLPGFWLDFQKAKTGGLEGDPRLPLASPGSLSLEFTRLSQLSGDPKYYDAISRVTTVLEQYQNVTRLPGMWPAHVNFQHVDLHGDNYFTLGALADSAYEYLPKMHALLSGTNPIYAKMAKYSFKSIKEHLLFRPMLPEQHEDILFTGDARVASDGKSYLTPNVQHLGCFAGGIFAFAGRLFAEEEYVTIGSKLTNGCIWAYDAFPTGIMPEIFTLLSCKDLQACQWDEEHWQKNGGAHLPRGVESVQVPSYMLRPEAIESVFVLYRVTGRREYQDAAWRMFRSIMNSTKTRYGNSAIANVQDEGESSKLDSMESFWLAETLKYFYLIFSPPDTISLDDYVFNTEAHPLLRTK